MNIYLVRHAEAESLGPTISRDADRKLTSDGEATARTMGKVLARIDSRIGTILTSPLIRARQTGEILLHELVNRPVLRTSENLSPGFRPKALLEELYAAGTGSSIVAVGHQPDLGRLIGSLIADSPHVSVTMTTLAVAKIELDGRAPDHQAQLHWLLTPETVRCIHSLREGEPL